jgi:hypothetical protein
MELRDMESDERGNNRPVSHWHRPVGRRNVIAGIAGLGIAAGIGVTQVVAQTATPSATDQTGDTATAQTDKAAEIGAAYTNFVGKLTTNLGESDPTKVDTAIRDALKAMVDEQFDAGNISRNLADDLKTRIDSSNAPLAVAMLGGMGLHRMERRQERRHKRRDDHQSGSDSDTTTEKPGTEASPSV